MIDDPLNRLKVKRGSELPQSKLTEDDVIEIREIVEMRAKADERIKELYNEIDQIKYELRKVTNNQLAQHYGIHRRTLDRVIFCEGWTHV